MNTELKHLLKSNRRILISVSEDFNTNELLSLLLHGWESYTDGSDTIALGITRHFDKNNKFDGKTFTKSPYSTAGYSGIHRQDGVLVVLDDVDNIPDYPVVGADSITTGVHDRQIAIHRGTPNKDTVWPHDYHLNLERK